MVNGPKQTLLTASKQKLTISAFVARYSGSSIFYLEGVGRWVGLSYLCGITLALLRSLGRRDCSHIVIGRS